MRLLPPPKSADDVRRFLGMTGYYRRFIKNYAQITINLRALIKKNTVFCWSEETEKEFQNLKDILSREPVMAYPDFNLQFILTTDASKYGYGAVLSQIQNKVEVVIAYASKSTNEHEQKYFTTELEAGAAVWAIEKFKTPYLLDRPFTLVTDHRMQQRKENVTKEGECCDGGETTSFLSLYTINNFYVNKT